MGNMYTVLTPDDLEAYLQSRGIDAEVVRLDVPTPTVEAAASALGTSPEHILKTVVFMVNAAPVLVVARGKARINTRALARLLGVGRKKVRVARPEEVLEATGYVAGAVPPLGHRQELPILLDQRVLAVDVAYAGGGAENALLKIAPRTLLEATGAQVVSLQEAPPSAP